MPDFDELLADCTAELRQTVKLACKVTGVPKPVVTWYKGKRHTSETTVRNHAIAVHTVHVCFYLHSPYHVHVFEVETPPVLKLFPPLMTDGRAVEADPHHIIIEDPDGSCTLILDNMTADDSGQYMCFATSTAGNASTLGKITVQGQSPLQRGYDTNIGLELAKVNIADYS